MRILVLIILFSLIIVGFFYAFDPTKGTNLANQKLLTEHQRNELSKLPRP